jgi:CheY-like chemotaxis protein/two-component sensor histidine kinase
MLNLSKIEEGHVSQNYVQGDLVGFVRFIVNSFQGYADSRAIGLHFQSQHPELMMDIEMEKLEESLSNLLSNAIKYTPEGGEVYISIQKRNRAKISGQQVEISVRDTGIGIPEDQLDKIFIRFYRVEDKQYPYQEGTGIGLTLVSEYLKLMKGSIRVGSKPSIGSEFVITLPVTQNAKIGEFAPLKTFIHKQENAVSQSEEIPHMNNSPRLLIIEDNCELTDYLAGLLKIEYQILTAENGHQGIEQAIKYIPDIILSDVMMPGKDGFQVCKELKNDFRTNHIPIVLLTARADTDSRISGLEHGADVYLTKPFNKKELRICLNNLLVQREILRLKFSAQVLNKVTIEKEAGLNEKFLGRVIMYLEENYQNDRYGIFNLYSDMKISRVQLHRKLTALTGQSASGFIRNFRLQKARNLLVETRKNVSDIAYEVGFADANYFSKAFISEYGLTASECRNSFG